LAAEKGIQYEPARSMDATLFQPVEGGYVYGHAFDVVCWPIASQNDIYSDIA
jgi:hypothetical protein